MFDALPQTPEALSAWTWPEIEPFYQDLANRTLTPDNIETWMRDWTHLDDRVNELQRRLRLAVTQNTADEKAEKRFQDFMEHIFPPTQAADQLLKEKLLSSGLEPAGFEVPMRKERTLARLFRQENLPLLIQDQKLGNEYDKIVGAQAVEWQGKEWTISQLQPIYQDPDRAVREQVWRLAAERQMADREAINNLWTQLLQIRQQLAANADKESFLHYRWDQMLRLDYTPEDCVQFQEAIEEVAVPAAQRVYEKRRQRLGLDRLRPWDLSVEPLGRPPLKPFTDIEMLKTRARAIFYRVDPQLGDYFDIMIREDLLDLANRKNKAPGAYCTTFHASKRPFIFANAVGLQRDVRTILHESGHAFHAFEVTRLPYHQQRHYGLEFAEVASMSMELLAAPYLAASEGGFYSEADAARARIEHLEGILLFWPYMAVVDAFQHWVYAHPEQAMAPANCDARWADLWNRFMIGEDWSGLEQAMATGWHRKQHIHRSPMYYVEYGLAQLGAVQVWGNALQDQAGAVAQYRRALALGGTRTLPDLFAAAGAKLAFDAQTLGEAVALIEKTIEELEQRL